MGLRPKSNERAFWCGMTGSGKTYGAMHLLAPIARLVVIDPKEDETIERYGMLEDDTDLALDRITRGDKARIRVLDPERYPLYLRAALAGENCIVYIDEVYLYLPPGGKPTPELTAVWTTGRSKNVGGWAATQRPTWLPLFLVSESENYFMFRLRLEDDRRRMAGYMGEEVMQPIPYEHGFYYSRASDTRPTLYKQLGASSSVTAPTQAEAQTSEAA